jgi:hypothetical protein
MKFIEPTFDVGGELWPALSADPGADIRALEHKIAKQSTELNLRVIEIVELYNNQQRQANELQNAYDEIDRLNRVIVTLHVTATQLSRNQKCWPAVCSGWRLHTTSGRQTSPQLSSRWNS